MSLVCHELVEARGLVVVLGQAGAAMFIEEPEIELRVRVSLVGG